MQRVTPLAQRLPPQSSAADGSQPFPRSLAHVSLTCGMLQAKQPRRGLGASTYRECTCRARRESSSAMPGPQPKAPQQLWQGALGWVADRWRAAFIPEEERHGALVLAGRRVAQDYISKLLKIKEAALELGLGAQLEQQAVAEAMAGCPELRRLGLELQVAKGPADLAAVAAHEGLVQQLGELQLISLKLAQCQLEAQRLSVAATQVALHLQPLASARVQYVGTTLCLGQKPLTDAVLVRAVEPLRPARESSEALATRLVELQGELQQASRQAATQLAAIAAQQ